MSIYRHFTEEELREAFDRLASYAEKFDSENPPKLLRNSIGYKCSNFFSSTNALETRAAG